MLDHFFAVTKTSIYEIVATGRGGSPSVQKIASDNPSDVFVGQELEKGTMVAIGKVIICYTPRGPDPASFERRVEMLSPQYLGGNTSHLVALFETVEAAKECFGHKDRKPADERWLDRTKAILEAIGPNHPIFYICTNPNTRLLP